MDSSARLNLNNRLKFDNYSFAYNSDVGAPTQLSGFKNNSRINAEKKQAEMTILSSSFGHNRFKNAYLESSFDNPHKILINDQDQLHVIMEKRKPRKSKNIPTQQIKKKEKITNYSSNYRKRVMEVEKQKKMIQEIEERYKEYSTKTNPYKQMINKPNQKAKLHSIEPKKANDDRTFSKDENAANKSGAAKKKFTNIRIGIRKEQLDKVVRDLSSQDERNEKERLHSMQRKKSNNKINSIKQKFDNYRNIRRKLNENKTKNYGFNLKPPYKPNEALKEELGKQKSNLNIIEDFDSSKEEAQRKKNIDPESISLMMMNVDISQ